MCISPIRLENGSEVACHECWQCLDRRVNDWVGRNIAESRTSIASYAVTLTYGRSRAGDADHVRAALLTYSDVQKYLKLLRRHRYSVRYFVTGEYGGLKGRAHWHVVLHFGPRMPLKRRGKVVPDADMSPVPPLTGVGLSKRWLTKAIDVDFMHQRVDDDGQPVFIKEDGVEKPALWWPHGWSHWTEGTSSANIRYNCKYVLKDVEDAERQGHLAMSKKPPLGARYFQGLAERYVKQGLAPQDLSYRFPDVRRKKENGSLEVVPFALQGKCGELFLERFVTAWEQHRPGEAMPNSQLVENWLEWGALSVPDDPVRFADFAERRSVVLPSWMAAALEKPGRGDLYPWMSAKAIKWDERRHCWVSPGLPWSDEHEWLWLFDEKKGARRWQRVTKGTIDPV